MPSISRRGSSFRIVVSMGYDSSGRQIRKTTTFRPPENISPRKAEKLASEYAFEFQRRCQGLVNMKENIRFRELLDWYDESIAPYTLKESTYQNNRRFMELYVLPYIGGMKLKDISTAVIDSLFARLHRSGSTTELFRLRDVSLLPCGTRRGTARRAGLSMETVSTAARGGTITRPSAEKLALAMGKPLAALFVPQPRDNSLDASTVMRIRTALSPVFATAMKKEIITRNPVINATSPKDPAKTRDFLNAEQCRALLRILDDMPNRQNARAIQTLLLTGMRVGELTSLHWEDIDLEGGFVNIRYNLYRINGEYKLSTPKTRSSARVIAVPARVVEIFREQRAWQDNRRAEEKDRWIDRGCVFSGRYGEYMSRNYLNVEFKKTLAKYDFPRIHLHDLRHANASLLINMGVPVKVISEHLGHSSTLTTENIYAHVFNESRAKAADAVVRALSDVAGKN